MSADVCGNKQLDEKMSRDQRQDKLVWLMQKNTWSAKDVAKICGVSLSQVYSWTTFNMARVIPEKHLLKLQTASDK
jgi:hypothetical protein